VKPVKPVDIGEPAIGFSTEPLTGTSSTFLYSVGDRILLTTGLNLGPKAENDPTKGPSDDLLERAIRAEADLLTRATLPGD
jgi:hypothetical protein